MVFFKRKPGVDVAPYVRRVIDLTTPNRPFADEQRMELRYNRTFPLLLNPYRSRKICLDETQIAFSRDWSDHGIGVLAMADLNEEEYIVTTWPAHEEFAEPYCFVAEVRDVRPFSLGLWIVGMRFSDVLNVSQPAALRGIVEIAKESLLPISQV